MDTASEGMGYELASSLVVTDQDAETEDSFLVNRSDGEDQGITNDIPASRPIPSFGGGRRVQAFVIVLASALLLVAFSPVISNRPMAQPKTAEFSEVVDEASNKVLKFLDLLKLRKRRRSQVLDGTCNGETANPLAQCPQTQCYGTSTCCYATGECLTATSTLCYQVNGLLPNGNPDPTCSTPSNCGQATPNLPGFPDAGENWLQHTSTEDGCCCRAQDLKKFPAGWRAGPFGSCLAVLSLL